MISLEEFNSSFEDFRAPLKAFVLRTTASVADTEDIIQDTYIKASNKLETFKGLSSLKTWVFSIATNHTKDFMKAKKRWTENTTDICKEAALGNPQFFGEAIQINQSSPQGQFEIKEHISFCFTCVSKSLPLEQQLSILLKEVHGFSVKEIGEILEQTEAMVKYYLNQGRGNLSRIFDQRCSLINKKGVCHQCTELNGIFNPKQNAQEEMMKIKMVKDAAKVEKQNLLDLRMKILQELDPFESKAAELQLHHLEHNRKVMENHLKNK